MHDRLVLHAGLRGAEEVIDEAEERPLRENTVTATMLEAAAPLLRAPPQSLNTELLPHGRLSCGGDLVFPNLVCAFAGLHRALLFPMLPGKCMHSMMQLRMCGSK